MPSDPRLIDLPVLRTEAERLARESHDAYWALMDDLPPKFAGGFKRDMTLVQSNLLADPSRPESRDALVRLCEATDTRWTARELVPSRRRSEYASDGEDHYAVLCGDIEVSAHWGITEARRDIPQLRRAYWLSLRDDPEALTLAAMEVLRG